MYRPNQYRNGYSSTTQTLTQQQNSGSQTTTSSNIFTRSGHTLNQTSGSNSNSDSIIFAVVTGNLQEVTRLVNSSNVNNVIDTKNGYTALHYAVKLPSNDIVNYLMNCGANPNIKQNEGKDSIDLSIESNKRFLVNKVIEKTNKELDEIYTKYDENKYTIKKLEKENKQLIEENTYLQKTNTDYAKKVEELKEENKNTKRKLEDSEKAFENLLKKNKK